MSSAHGFPPVSGAVSYGCSDSSALSCCRSSFGVTVRSVSHIGPSVSSFDGLAGLIVLRLTVVSEVSTVVRGMSSRAAVGSCPSDWL